MTTLFHRIAKAGVFLFLVAITAAADDAKDDAIKKDRKLIAGSWRVVFLEVNGTRAADEDARKLLVINGDDGTWKLLSEGNEVRKGTSVIEPTSTPKTIDFETTDEEGKLQKFVGIYELAEKSRKLCFAASGMPRPTEFSSKSGSEHIFVTFERETAK